MKILWIALGLWSGAAFSLQAQIGLSGAYRFNRAPEWSMIDNGGFREIEAMGEGYSLGLDYWFRLKEVRVEFLPEFNFGSYRQTLFDEARTEARYHSLFFNVNVYPFDFFSDCDCPTFSKSDPLLQSGFFLQLSPGYSHAVRKGILPEGAISENAGFFSLGGAVGLDIGISDLLTLSPLAGLRYYLPSTWSDLSRIAAAGAYQLRDERGPLWQMHAGIRVGLRFDQ
jgi:hypothetical protein